MVQLTFAGAAATVTGSRYLLDTGVRRLLIDCGLFQGYKQLRLRNRAPFPVPPSSVDAVVLTHAHLDHSGYLPALVRDGFDGPIFATEATHQLCRILLRDSAHLQEEEARFANRHGFSRHRPAEPLYTVEDAERALGRFRSVAFDQPFEPADGLRCRLRPAGHLLGAASVLVEHAGRSTLFSGDLGRPNDPLMRPPAPPLAADTLIVESTYANRVHPPDDGEAILSQVIRDTAAHGGTVLIPSFAVGRAQSVLLALSNLKQRGEIPDLPVFLDSPMATDATALYRQFSDLHRLDHAQCQEIFRVARVINSPDESKALAALRVPAVIIAASGMATGGRVLHHLKRLLPDARNHLLFVGYQAGGTRGARLLAGEPEIKIHGDWLPVRARVSQIESWSAHADGDEILAWLRGLPTAPSQVFVCHGEADAADRLRQRIERELGWSARVPEYLETVELSV